ncbi:PDZ domain-containing protein [Sporolactobacillus sp. THM19-2]|jgi:PDZ domain-containing protein|nr:PDZ domain-containing protein [Sporolactobacillus sp. THM19-2]
MVLALTLLTLFFIRLPYFVQSPGKAQSMAGMVKVSDAYPVNGNYRLVYIYLGQANIYQYLWAKFDGNKYTTLIREKNIRLPDEDDTAYNLRQKNYMTGAQQSAAYIAYKTAGKHPKLVQQGVLVLDVIPSMPASKVLKSGDVIIGMGNHRITSIKDMNALIGGKKAGDRLALTIVRNKQVKTVSVEIGKFPKRLAEAGKKEGIGIYQSEQAKVDVNPPVKFDIQNIGGPSAGLMMTLEIYDQLTKQDLAAGRDIAGTGTIELDGSVGPIGGISEKIVGADQSGTDIFFAPVAEHEYEAAKKTAKEIGSEMKIVPVKTFEDAVRYLEKTRN